MVNKYTYKNLTWIDLEAPTPADISPVVSKYSLSPLVGEELLSPTRKSKIDAHDTYVYLVLHIPFRVQNGQGKIVQTREVDFVIGKDFLITSHYEVIEPLHSFAKTFETNSILDKDGLGSQASVIFYYIMKRLYGEMLHDLEGIREALAEVEKHIFAGHERKMVETLSLLSREIIDFRQSTRLHQEVLTSFTEVPAGFFDKNFNHFIADLQQTFATIHDLISANKELLTDLRETNASLLSTKQNEHMKLFTILAFVTFPLSLVVALFSLPTAHTPIIGMPYDWEILATGVVLLAVIMYAYFKERGWI